MILFSSISPNYEQSLKDELFGCFKHIGIPFDILDRMPTRDRKYYISKHNEVIEGEKSKSKRDNSEVTGIMINKFTDIEQQKISNMGKEKGEV